jgi:alpha-amylase/alpha-mannosidase (GH57 family)
MPLLMSRADVIIHGHFYQPPRENPWTDVVEREWSAEPFHDWNARIQHECYAANSASPVYDPNGQVEQILDNYEWISFNFGPTLLRWMEGHDPGTLERIVAADRRSRRRWDGHGNAMAQVYNHMILPLADAHDRRTQIHWARLEFEHRFGRAPEGMWLAETAANLEVLDELLDQGLRFVVLAPGQAGRLRTRGEAEWKDLDEGVDPSRAYFYRSSVDPMKELGVFFYDGALGAACSYGNALADGGSLTDAVEAAFDESRTHRQLLHVAVDGETAGHHVQWGNLALSWALARELPRRGYRLTNYSRYLAEHPPETEVELDLGPLGEGTSWSCAHGVGRWIRDCGCRIAPHQDSSQQWRTPLREALDLVRDRSRELYVDEISPLVVDPWRARDEYVRVLLDDSSETREGFLRVHLLDSSPSESQGARVWTLLELQHQAQLMYTSCGWFFDDVSGLEAVQILRYAARCLELFDELSAVSPREEFLDTLAQAQSNESPPRNGREIFERDAESVRVTAERVVAHLAMSAVLAPPAPYGKIGLYEFHREQFHVRQRDELQLATGHFRLLHRRTARRHDLQVAMIHRGRLEFTAAVRPYKAGHFEEMQQALHDAFDGEDAARLGTQLDHYFQLPRYGAEDLLEPERQEILGRLFASVTEVFAESNAGLYAQYRNVLSSLRELGMDLPDELASTIGFALRRRLEARLLHWVENPSLQEDDEVRTLLDEMRLHRPRVASPSLAREFRRHVQQAIEDLAELQRSRQHVDALAKVDFVLRCLDWAADLGLDLDLRGAQVLFYEQVHPQLERPYPPALSTLRERLHFSPRLEV